MKEFWDERYAATDFAYGKAPNQFLATHLEVGSKRKMLVPADGEGRNGVFAATKDWQVHAFDLSAAGRDKALALAKENEVEINYTVADFRELDVQSATYDGLVLIYAHIPADLKAEFHVKMNEALKVGGMVWFEAYSKNNLAYVEKNPAVGGPKSIEMLYDIDELKTYFPNFEFIYCAEEVVELNEGNYHNGTGSVIRFIGKKLA